MTNQDFSITTERAVMLQPEGLLRMVGPATLSLMRGQMWLTVDGKQDDHMLAAGDRFKLEDGARALVQAVFAPAYALIADTARPTWSQRAAQAMRVATRRLAGAFA